MQTSRLGRKADTGFTLVEVMVALLIGAILSGAAISVLVTSKRSYEIQDDLARLQENARFAMDQMMRDLRMAGYFGCMADIGKVTNHVVGGAGTLFDALIGLEGFEANAAPAATTWFPSASTADTPPTIGAIAAIAGSDLVTVRYLAPDDPFTVEAPFMPQSSAVLHAAAGNGLVQGEIIAVSDCSSADVFQISNSNPDGSGTIGHNTGAATVPGNENNPPVPGCPGGVSHCLSKVYEGDAVLMRLRAVRYFVGQDAGGPALYRVAAVVTGTTAAPAAQRLVDGVEMLQLTFGEDTDGDDAADTYRTANAVANWSQVHTARIGLLVRTVDQYGEASDVAAANLNVNGQDFVVPDDRRRRRVFTATVELRNPQ